MWGRWGGKAGAPKRQSASELVVAPQVLPKRKFGAIQNVPNLCSRPSLCLVWLDFASSFSSPLLLFKAVSVTTDFVVSAS